jgi:hypothetical protein
LPIFETLKKKKGKRIKEGCHFKSGATNFIFETHFVMTHFFVQYFSTIINTMDTNFDDDTIQQIVRTAIQHPQFILLKSQQRGEEEPSFEEKQRVLESLLRRDKALFLGSKR